jgi:hypothetical protein
VVTGGREILAMYALEGDPLRALSKFSPPVSVLHVYAQPRASEFLAAQEAFAREHSWYAVHRLVTISKLSRSTIIAGDPYRKKPQR